MISLLLLLGLLLTLYLLLLLLLYMRESTGDRGDGPIGYQLENVKSIMFETKLGINTNAPPPLLQQHLDPLGLKLGAL